MWSRYEPKCKHFDPKRGYHFGTQKGVPFGIKKGGHFGTKKGGTLGGEWGRVGGLKCIFFNLSAEKKAKNVIRRKKINVDFFVEFWVT